MPIMRIRWPRGIRNMALSTILERLLSINMFMDIQLDKVMVTRSIRIAILRLRVMVVRQIFTVTLRATRSILIIRLLREAVVIHQIHDMVTLQIPTLTTVL